jgi:cyanuric acid amidohydrolase
MARATALAIAAAMEQAGMTQPEEVAFALVKAPLPTPGDFGGREEDYAALKGVMRGAAALGAAAALGELPWSSLGSAVQAGLHGRRTLVAAGTDVTAPEALVLGHTAGWGGPLGIAATVLDDMLDAPAVTSVLARLGLVAAPQLAPAAAARLRAILVKGEMPGSLRGHRPAALDDSDIHPNRHFRAALSGLIGAVTGDLRVFLSGGAEHQAPPGGVLLAIIAETPEEALP